MANEATYSNIGDLRTSEVLATEFLYLQAAREALPNHPALVSFGDLKDDGSATKKMSTIGLMGYDLLAQIGDGVQVGNTAITDGSITVTVSRRSKAYARTDLARIADKNKLLSPEMLARDAFMSTMATLVNVIANLMGGFSSVTGTSGVNLSVANWLAAIATLEIANVEGPYLAILHPRQKNDLKEDVALTSGGAVQWMAASADLVQMMGNGLSASFAEVPIFSTTHVPTANAGADRAGGMFGRGAICWAHASFPDEGDANQVLIGAADGRAPVLFERDRTARAGETAYVTHANLGASEGIDACGTALVTDA